MVSDKWYYVCGRMHHQVHVDHRAHINCASANYVNVFDMSVQMYTVECTVDRIKNGWHVYVLFVLQFVVGFCAQLAHSLLHVILTINNIHGFVFHVSYIRIYIIIGDWSCELATINIMVMLSDYYIKTTLKHDQLVEFLWYAIACNGFIL